MGQESRRNSHPKSGHIHIKKSLAIFDQMITKEQTSTKTHAKDTGQHEIINKRKQARTSTSKHKQAQTRKNNHTHTSTNKHINSPTVGEGGSPHKLAPTKLPHSRNHTFPIASSYCPLIVGRGWNPHIRETPRIYFLPGQLKDALPVKELQLRKNCKRSILLLLRVQARAENIALAIEPISFVVVNIVQI
jgi:hypothetical protein